jgi:hypothetical protein
VSQKASIVHLQVQIIYKQLLAFVQLTILIIYDRLCSLFCTTDLLKNSCLACIGPAYDKNTKTGTVVALLEYFHILHICINYKLNIILYKFSWPT